MIKARKQLSIALVILAGALVMPVSSALAANGHGLTSSFGGTNSTVTDPEPLSGPTGVAVNEKTKEVDVIDAGHNRIARFDAAGNPEGQFTGSETPAGEFLSPNAIAVDNDPGSLSYGDVYVSDAGHNVVDKFTPEGTYLNQLTGRCELNEPLPCSGSTFVAFTALEGVAVDAAGNLTVYESHSLDKFDDAVNNAYVQSQAEPFATGEPGIAVDSHDNVYIVDKFVKRVLKFLSDGSFAGFSSSDCACAGVGVDPSTNNVYVDQGTSVAEYPPFAEPFEEPAEFGSGALAEGSGIAISGTTHTVYVADSKTNDVLVFGEGPKPGQPITENPTAVEGTAATLKGKLEGGESKYHFAYNTNGTCTGEGTLTTADVTAGGSENVTVKITGLIAKTKYTYCLLDENKYGQESGSAETFETTSSAPLTEKTSSTVKEAKATVEATVNPEREESSCVVQYGKSEPYEHETPCEPASLGEGEKGVPVTAKITGLEPDTTYDYRIFATNATGKQPGPDETFTTEVITPTQVETAQAADVTATSATIGGQANPRGGATYYVEYGAPTCSLNGKPNYAWWLCATKSGEAGPLTGNTVQDLAPIEITGLTPGTTYNYWVVAHNKNGTERGEEATFTTPSTKPVTPPVAIVPTITPPTIIAPPPPVITPKVTITTTRIKHNTLLVTINTTAAGTVTITGTGIPKTTKTLPAGTHQITIPLTKTGKKDAKKHKKITLHVVLKAAGKSASTSKTVKL